METIIEKLKKIKELADRGYRGEAIAAKRMLEQLLKKHNLTIDDIEDSRRIHCKFKYNGRLSKKLLIQIIASVCERDVDIFRHKSVRNALFVELSQIEKLDAEERLEFHKSLFNRELKKSESAFFRAYIHKHSLFSACPSDGSDSGEKLSKEELEAILGAMSNLEDVSFHKSLQQ